MSTRGTLLLFVLFLMTCAWLCFVAYGAITLGSPFVAGLFLGLTPYLAMRIMSA
jgi:choline-glycine betaine transporter